MTLEEMGKLYWKYCQEQRICEKMGDKKRLLELCELVLDLLDKMDEAREGELTSK